LKSFDKNILIILPGDKLAGSEKVLSLIASDLYSKGFKIFVVIWFVDRDKTGQWDEFRQNYTFYQIENNLFLGFYGLVSLLKNISNREKIALTISSNITLNSVLGILRKVGFLKTGKLVIREPSSPFLRYKKSFKLFMYQLKYFLGYKYADLLIYQTTLMKETFEKNVSIKIKKIILPNPINIDHIKTSSTHHIITNDETYIIAAGRFIHEKGFDILLRAFSLLKNKEIKLCILGSGPLDLFLKDIARELGINDRVIFPGFIDNPFPYFLNASACVVSSRIEGFPNTLLQMLALNDRVLSTNCCGDLYEIPGLEIINSLDPIEIAQSIEYVLTRKSNKEKRKEIDLFLKKRNIKNYTETILEEINL
jgi:glycosyltransferase involved in cell wall biosynthesis